MNDPQSLLDRLDAIGRSLAARPDALALLGLGSVGQERERLDAWSDLDFFALVAEGRKAAFLEDLGWLAQVAPVAYVFRNTPDGYKLLYADGIFCEFAVFTPAELEQAAYAPGQVVWRRPELPESIAAPARPAPLPTSAPEEWLVGEALTNLYVGLARWHRGERLSAARFIQQYALDRLIDLAERREPPQPAPRDLFSPERRVEQRLPEFARHLPQLAQGYGRSPESALAILAYLERHAAVDPAMARAIRALAGTGSA